MAMHDEKRVTSAKSIDFSHPAQSALFHLFRMVFFCYLSGFFCMSKNDFTSSVCRSLVQIDRFM